MDNLDKHRNCEFCGCTENEFFSDKEMGFI